MHKMKRVCSLVYVSTSSLSSLLNPLPPLRTPLGPSLIKKYSKKVGGDYDEEHVLDKERAPSTAEIMDELSGEKEDNQRTLEEKTQQGFVSHTSEKALDAAGEAISGDADPDAVKKAYKEASPGQTYHKPRDDGGIGPTGV